MQYILYDPCTSLKRTGQEKVGTWPSSWPKRSWSWMPPRTIKSFSMAAWCPLLLRQFSSHVSFIFGLPFLANAKIEGKNILTNNLIWKGCCWLACTHTGYSLSLVPVTVFLPRKVSKSLSLSSLCQYCLLCMYASESDERPDRLLMFDLSFDWSHCEPTSGCFYSPAGWSCLSSFGRHLSQEQVMKAKKLVTYR